MSVQLKTHITLAFVLCAVLFCACGTKEELFDSYNSCFVPLSSNAAGFTLTPETASEMLRDVYEISLSSKKYGESSDYLAGVTFCLSCPVEYGKCYWYITSEGYAGSKTDLDDLSAASLSDKWYGKKYQWIETRNISFYIPKSKDCIFFNEALHSEQSCSYRIHLVVEVGNDAFHDDAVLVIRALTEAQKKEFQIGSEEGGSDSE